MPLTGTIPITDAQGVVSTGAWFCIGEDGTVYTVSGSQGISSPTRCKVGSASTLATCFTRTPTEWADDFNALALGGVPATSGSGANQAPIPIQGTAYFYHCGKAGGGANEWSIGVRYKIESPSSVVVDGGFAYKNTGAISGLLGTCWTFGSAVVDGELFAVCWLYNGIFDPQSGTYLIRLPLDFGGTTVDGSANAWNERRTYVGNRFGDSLGVPTYFNAPIYFNTCTVLKDPTNSTSVKILTYRSESSLPGSGSNLTTPGSESVIVDWDAQSAGLLTDEQATFGQPWSDDGLGINGTVTANNQFNSYSGPTIGDGGGPTQRELMFTRRFADSLDTAQIRRFAYDETTGLFTTVDAAQFTVVGGVFNDSGALAYRRAGQTVYGAIYSTGAWRLGELLLPPIGGSAARRFVGKLGPVRQVA